MYRDRCLEVAGIDVMASAEECIADALAGRHTQEELFPPRLMEVVPRDPLGNVVAERGLLVSTADYGIEVAFSVDAVDAQRLERTIEGQLQARFEELGFTAGDAALPFAREAT